MLQLQRPELTELKPRITVIGVGGAGCNAVANMVSSRLQGVDFVVANTDAQSLAASQAETRIQLGLKITQGLGAGARPEIGCAAAEETIDQIEAVLEGCHMCFITAGMGGGTGTGAAPVVARAAREKGILTVGVVTKPFHFEGQRRMRQAEEGIVELQKHVDTLLIIPNQNLFLIANASTSFKDAFAMADQVLHQGVRGITDLMIMPGLINLDFADIRTVMSEMGKAMMGTGEATGENRALQAAEKAIANPLLDEVSMRGAKGVIINVTGSDDLGLHEVDEAVNHIRSMVDADANILFGAAFNPDLDGVMRVSVVATGIDAVARGPLVVAPAKSPFGAASGAFPAAPVAVPVRPVPAVSRPEPEPVAERIVAAAPFDEPYEDEPEELDLVEATRLEPAPARQPELAAFTFTPSAPAAAPEPEPEPVEEERPLTLFEKMLSLSRGTKRTAPVPSSLAPAPERQPDAGEMDIPAFFKKQVNE